MALLTVDLNNEIDLKFALEIIETRLTELTSADGDDHLDAEDVQLESPSERQARLKRLRPLVEQLQITETWRILVKPFIDKIYPNAATIETMGQAMDLPVKMNSTNKAHTVKASLGKFEARTGLKVFTSTYGRPQKYSINPDIVEIVALIEAESKAK